MSKYLLLQYREEAEVAKEEIETFARQAEIDVCQLDAWNYLGKEASHAAALHFDKYVGVFIGGASTISVREHDSREALQLGVQDSKILVQEGIPTFASCFGFQLAALALECEVVHCPEEQENCSLAIHLTEEGLHDELLTKLQRTPGEVMVGHMITVHREGITSLPAGCVRLAQATYWEQIFRVEGKPFWAFQGHPEVDEQALRERLWIYREKYDLHTKEQFDEILSQYEPVHEANKLLAYFCEMF
ncbi:MAG: hypothetical protein KDD70_09870 [Bdellovibrionales bacterium]|nr:hypothetical protein [Bdellovibrionales bacterium]